MIHFIALRVTVGGVVHAHSTCSSHAMRGNIPRLSGADIPYENPGGGGEYG